MFAETFAGFIAKIIALFGISISLTVAPIQVTTRTQTTELTPTTAEESSLDTNSSIGSDTQTSTTSSQDAATTSVLPKGSGWLTTLPLGDGKYVTTGPKKGFIYLCHVDGEGGGAQGAGSWIDEVTHTWSPGKKMHVQGNVSWPNAAISIKTSGSNRVISTNDLPVTHTSGTFPIASSDPVSQFDRNPNTIQAQSFTFTLPANPAFAAQPGCIYGEVGVMTTGVLLFDGFDAENRDAAAWEVQDHCDAHPQVSGAYHYHSLSNCIKNISVDNVIGYAFDGFPITGSKLPNGNYLHTADLDECHGLVSDVSLDGKKVSTYHYVMTQDFPYSVSCFKGKSTLTGPLGGKPGIPQKPVSSGTPNGSSNVPQSGSQTPQQSGAQHMPSPAGPPQEAIAACAEKQAHDDCNFVSPMGDTISGICDTPPNSSLACIPN